MHHICFELSMPRTASWDGKWSGEGETHAILKSVSNKYFEDNKDKLIGHWRYRWDDGWEAAVTGREINVKEKRLINKNNEGFWGYDWMVESIMLVGGIYNRGEWDDILRKEEECV